MAFTNAVTYLSELVADKIVGALIETADSGLRWVLSGAPQGNAYIDGYTGDAQEIAPATIAIESTGAGAGNLRIRGPAFGSSNAHQPEMVMSEPGPNLNSTIQFKTDNLNLSPYSSSIKGIAFGQSTANLTTANPYGFTPQISHGLADPNGNPLTPQICIANAGGRIEYFAYPWAVNNSIVQFGVTHYQAQLANVSVNVQWLVIA